VIKRAIHEKIRGTFHLGTNRIFSRAELGSFLATALGHDRELVHPIRMSDIAFSEIRPTHNVLDCSKIKTRLNFQFCELEDAFVEIKNLHHGIR